MSIQQYSANNPQNIIKAGLHKPEGGVSPATVCVLKRRSAESFL